MSYTEFNQAKPFLESAIEEWKKKNENLINNDKPYAFSNIKYSPTEGSKYKLEISNIFYNPEREEVSFDIDKNKYFHDIKSGNFIEADFKKYTLFFKESMMLIKHEFGRYNISYSNEYGRDVFFPTDNSNQLRFGEEVSPNKTDLKIKNIQFDDDMKLVNVKTALMYSFAYYKSSKEIKDFAYDRMNDQTFNSIEDVYKVALESDDILMLHDIDLDTNAILTRFEAQIEYSKKVLTTLNNTVDLRNKFLTSNGKVKEILNMKKDDNKNMGYHKFKLIYKNLTDKTPVKPAEDRRFKF